jgi:hypothetical protein
MVTGSGWTTEKLGFDYQQGQETVLFFTEARPVPGPTQPLGNRGTFSGIKRPGCVADYSHPSNAEVRNVRSYTSTPPFLSSWRGA